MQSASVVVPKPMGCKYLKLSLCVLYFRSGIRALVRQTLYISTLIQLGEM